MNEKNAEKMNFFKKYRIKTMLSFFGMYKKYYIITLLFSLISSLILYLTPLINILIFDKGIKNKDFKVLFFSVLIMLLAYVIAEITKILKVKYDWFLDYKISKDLKTKVLVYCIENSQFSDKIGEYESLLERDATSYIQMACNESISFITNVVNAVSSTVILIKLQPDMAIVSFILQSMLILVRIKTQNIEEKKGIEMRNGYIALLSSINEIIYNIRKISVLGAENYVAKRYEKALDNEYNVTKSQSVFRIRIDAVISLTMNAIACMILLWGGYRIIIGTMTLGKLISFNQYSSSLSSPIIGLISIPSHFAAEYETIEKISMIFEYKSDEKKVKLKNVSEIDVSGLSFSYDSDLILDNTKVNFKKNHVYYICGQSGTGKSTFLQLVSGQRIDYTGTIKYDGYDLKSISSKNLPDLVSVVTQDSVLFNDTIISNIVLDKDIDYERIRYLCQICSILEDIEELPDGFDTVISEKGDSLSGGQKSRICLARALYQDNPVLIIDEVTSGLDGITERNIRERLADAVKDKIVIIVTHSKNFIMENSVIYNIDNQSIKSGEPICLK